MVLCCLFFGVRISLTFHLMFVHYIFSSVWVAEGPFVWKELPIRLAVCSHCILSICNFCYLSFGSESGVWFLIAPVPVNCLRVTFNTCTKIQL